MGISPVSLSIRRCNKDDKILACLHRLPAYEKYRDLAVKIPPTLTLPYKYKLLEDMFRGADTVVSIMYNRLERCTFNKLKKAVQDMIRKYVGPHLNVCLYCR